MSEFAVDSVQHRAVIEPNGSASFPFGPPTAGLLAVILVAVEGFDPSDFLLTDDPSREPGLPIGAIPLIRPALGGDLRPVTDVLGVGDIGPIDGGGVTPGKPISPTTFRVEVIDAKGDVRARRLCHPPLPRILPGSLSAQLSISRSISELKKPGARIGQTMSASRTWVWI